MEETNRSTQIVRFGSFEVDLRAAELRRSGLRVRLQEQPFRILELLLERPGETVTREELRQRLWPADVFVAVDQSLNNAIKKLRAALHDPAENQRFIQTVARHGYRFIAPVEVVRVATSADPPSRSWPSAWIAVLCLFGLALAAYITVHRPGVRPPAARIALAVLPFKNLSSDPSQEYFSDGLTEEMITQLSTANPRGLGVLARTSTMRYKDTQKGADEISKELHVDFLVEGSMRRENQRVRISAQLVRASDQIHVWAKSYERDLREILLLQREVAQDIAHEINVSVSPAASTQRSTVAALNPDAYEAYLLDDSLAAAHTSLAMVRFNYDWDWSRAERGFQRAIELDSDYPNAHHWYADYLSAIGQHDQAITESERARRLDPLSPIINAWLGWRHHFARQYDAAVEQYRRTLELDPNFAPTHLVLGQAYEQQGRASEALAELQQAEHLARGGPLYVAALAHALAGAGRRADAERELRRLVELSARQYVSPVQIAIVHAGLGNAQEAIEWLEKGIDGRSAGMVWIKDDPRLDPLRPDSRFQDIVTRLRFP